MKTETVLAYYKTVAKAARALGMTRDSIYKWGENVPIARQFEIEVKTNRTLKSDWTLKKEGAKPDE